MASVLTPSPAHFAEDRREPCSGRWDSYPESLAAGSASFFVGRHVQQRAQLCQLVRLLPVLRESHAGVTVHRTSIDPVPQSAPLRLGERLVSVQSNEPTAPLAIRWTRAGQTRRLPSPLQISRELLGGLSSFYVVPDVAFCLLDRCHQVLLDGSHR